MQYSYDCAPKQLYDENLINQAKATMSQSQFEREFGAIFTDDSSGYFKTSKMALCTIPDGDLPVLKFRVIRMLNIFLRLTPHGLKQKVLMILQFKF